MANLDEGTFMSERADKITSTHIDINMTPEQLKNRAKCLADYIKHELATLYVNGFSPGKISELIRMTILLDEDDTLALKSEALDMEMMTQRETLMSALDDTHQVQTEILHTLGILQGTLENLSATLSPTTD